MLLIFTTQNDKESAVRLGRALLAKRLIACYNLFPVESAYWWKGKVEEANEILMILKTREKNLGGVEEYITENSAYETPEIVTLKPEKVNDNYFCWIEAELH